MYCPFDKGFRCPTCPFKNHKGNFSEELLRACPKFSVLLPSVVDSEMAKNKKDSE